MRKLIAILVLLFVPTSLFAQTPRKKHKDFGSSLKKLQWDPAKKEAVAIELPKSQTIDEDVDVIRTETSLVAWDVLVLDQKGNNIDGLTAADFVVVEDNQPQNVRHFFLGDNQSVPRSIVLIIDYSASQFRYLRNSIDPLRF